MARRGTIQRGSGYSKSNGFSGTWSHRTSLEGLRRNELIWHSAGPTRITRHDAPFVGGVGLEDAVRADAGFFILPFVWDVRNECLPVVGRLSVVHRDAPLNRVMLRLIAAVPAQLAGIIGGPFAAVVASATPPGRGAARPWRVRACS